MRTDPATRELEFIAELAAETGLDLAAWMREIDGAASLDRNATIDWLKARHVYFRRASRAMWLERIHHNGGRPIFDGAAPAVIVDDGPPSRPSGPTPATAPHAAAEPAIEPSPTPAPVRAASAAEIEPVLARGKAYRPLAQYLIAEIRKALPGLVLAVERDLVVLAAPHTFGAIDVRPKEIRLGLALADAASPPLTPGRLVGSTVVDHIVALTDARTIDAQLLDVVRTAAQRAG
jgi:hypothetical protein